MLYNYGVNVRRIRRYVHCFCPRFYRKTTSIHAASFDLQINRKNPIVFDYVALKRYFLVEKSHTF